MKQLELLYEGKAKQVFSTDDPDKIIIHYITDSSSSAPPSSFLLSTTTFNELLSDVIIVF